MSGFRGRASCTFSDPSYLVFDTFIIQQAPRKGSRFPGDSYDESPVDRLTDRELEVFRLLGHGLSTNDVARKLNLSAKTVGTYRERIKDKLNLRNASELIRQAMLWVENEQIDTAPDVS